LLDRLRHRERLADPLRDALNEQVFVKLLLNTHSLLVMGRLGRYEGNLMTWVKPGNRKLIDRAVRYVRLLLDARGHVPVPSYEATARELLKRAAFQDEDQSVVLSTCEAFGLFDTSALDRRH
jgi:N-acetylmuramic acid 6-phosphate etherase